MYAEPHYGKREGAQVTALNLVSCLLQSHEGSATRLCPNEGINPTHFPKSRCNITARLTFHPLLDLHDGIKFQRMKPGAEGDNQSISKPEQRPGFPPFLLLMLFFCTALVSNFSFYMNLFCNVKNGINS